MILIYVCLLALLCFVLRKIAIRINVDRRLPKGPVGSLISGVLPDCEFHLFLGKLANKFGAMFSMRMRGQTFVVISDANLVRKAFAKAEMAGRPKTHVLNSLVQGFGIINSEGKLWSDQRRFLHSRLANLSESESRIRREVVSLLTDLFVSSSTTLDPKPLLQCYTANVITSLTMSKRFRPDDSKFVYFNHLLHEGFRLFHELSMADSCKLLFLLPGVQTAFQNLKDNRQALVDYMNEIIDEHSVAKNKEDDEQDLVDDYLRNVDMKRENARTNLVQVLLDLYSAGADNVKTTLLWLLLHLLHNPEVMKRVQQEVDEVIGEQERLPELKDMSHLPFTRAVIYESMRLGTLVPIGSPHATTQDVEFEGHVIPKDTLVISLLSAIHADPANFPEPDKFDPHRFLVTNEQGSLSVRRPSCFMPFGSGLRTCLGDKLSERQVFLFITSILHTFDLEPNLQKLPSIHQSVQGVTNQPLDFDLKLTPRRPELIARLAQEAILDDNCSLNSRGAQHRLW